jgi:hypothetical protein
MVISMDSTPILINNVLSYLLTDGQDEINKFIESGFHQHLPINPSLLIKVAYELKSNGTALNKETLAKYLQDDGLRDYLDIVYFQQGAASELATWTSSINDDCCINKPDVYGINLDQPPQLAGEICKYMSLTAKRLYPELYPLAALQIMALIGRKRKSIYTEKLNILSLAIAPSAAGKEHPQKVIKQLAKEHSESGRIHGSSASFKDMILNLFDDDGASLYCIDEVHTFFNSIQSKANSYEEKMEAELLKLSTTDLYSFRGNDKREILKPLEIALSSLEKKLDKLTEFEGADEYIKLQNAIDKNKRITGYILNGYPNPFFSLMGFSVPSKLDYLVTIEAIDSGLLGRIFFRRGRDTRGKLRRSNSDEFTLNTLEENIQIGLSNIRKSSHEIIASSEARIFLDLCVDWYDDDSQRNHETLGAIYARAPEQLYKAASVLALDGGIITLEIAKYAYKLTEASIEDLCYLLRQSKSQEKGASEELIINHAKACALKNCTGEGLTPGRLSEKITRNKEWEGLQQSNPERKLFDELIDDLLIHGHLELKKNGRKVRYISTI